MYADWSDDDIRKIIKERKLITPFQLLKMPYLINNSKFSTEIKDIDTKLKMVCDPNNSIDEHKLKEDPAILSDKTLRECRLYQIVEMSGHNEIVPIAKDIFRGFNSMQEAYTCIKLWPVVFIQERLGLKNKEQIGIASGIYDKLLEIENELKFAEKFFTIIKPDTILNVQTSGKLENFFNLIEFIDFVQSRYGGIVEINLVPTTYQLLDAYISDYDNGSIKYSKAHKLNEQNIQTQENKYSNSFHKDGERVFIGQAKDFIDRLDKLYLKEQR